MKTILATTYAVNPYKGSEDGMGWNFVLQISRFHKVIAITRENNQPHIEKYMAEYPNDLYQNISFLYFDLPYWIRFWKKGGRGAMLYYLLWQKKMVSFIKKQNIQYDIVHNLNFHNDWTPSYLWKLKKPFVWGPIGHHPQIPKQYLKPYGIKHLFINQLTWGLKNLFWKLSPDLKKTIKEAQHILCMNQSVSTTLKLKNNFSVMPSVATQDFGWEPNLSDSEIFTLISAGRFVPLKGFDLSIQSFANFLIQLPKNKQQKCELILVGSGPEEDFLRRLVKEKGIENHVRFISWIERIALLNQFKKSSAFLFPSHEGAGMVVAEAMSFGLPIICLDNEGPGEFNTKYCGFSAPHTRYQDTITELTTAIQTLYFNPTKQQEMRKAARERFENYFHWDRRGEQLKTIYKDL